jgi:hypothetical protein
MVERRLRYDDSNIKQKACKSEASIKYNGPHFRHSNTKINIANNVSIPSTKGTDRSGAARASENN